MLALGASFSPDSSGAVAADDMKLAKRLAFTCHQMYALTASGLAPEHTVFRSGTMSVGFVFKYNNNNDIIFALYSSSSAGSFVSS